MAWEGSGKDEREEAALLHLLSSRTKPGMMQSGRVQLRMPGLEREVGVSRGRRQAPECTQVSPDA